MLTLNQFTSLLNNLANAHGQIKTFGEGDAWEIGASKPVQYPLMWVTPQPSSTGLKLLNMKYRISFADIVFHDKSNELEVLSDTQQIALDILAQLNAPDFADDFVLDPNATLTPFTEKFDDEVAGWKVDINVKVNFLADRCAVPSSIVPGTVTPACAPVLVKNSDGSFTASFASGSVNTLADILFTDSDGNDYAIPAQTNITAKNLNQLVAEDDAAEVYDALVAAAKLADFIIGLENTDLDNLTTAQLDYVVSLLGSAQVQLLSSVQVGELSAGEIAEIIDGSIQYLTNGQLANLTTSQLNYITGLLTSVLVQLLSSTQVGYLSATQIQQLTGSQIANLTSSQVQALSGTQIGYLSATQIQQLTNTQIASLTSAQVQALTITQIGYLSSSQIQQLTNSQLGNLTTGQLQYILGSLMNNQFLQDNLTITQRNAVNEVYALQTGQTTSYATGDDGDYEHGRLVDFFTLKTNNIFGNTNRFTDETGSQTYTHNYVIDHATGLGWCTTIQGTANWATAISNANAFTLSTAIGTLSGFFLPNVSEVSAITIWSQVCLNFSPFNLNPVTAAQIWTSTTNYSSTTAAFRVSYQTFPGASSAPKAGSQPYLVCRKHF